MEFLSGPAIAFMEEEQAMEEQTVQEYSYDLYMAGPLFTAGERMWNLAVAERLEARGWVIFLPQRDAESADLVDTAMKRDIPIKQLIFERDVAGMDQSANVVACMDQADPDSGTCWESGYVYGRNQEHIAPSPFIKRIFWYRTDMREIRDFTQCPINLMMGVGGEQIALPDLAWTLTPDEVAHTIDWYLRRKGLESQN
jgi:nucleoside 2-deoxyribosyltransferase